MSCGEACRGGSAIDCGSRRQVARGAARSATRRSKSKCDRLEIATSGPALLSKCDRLEIEIPCAGRSWSAIDRGSRLRCYTRSGRWRFAAGTVEFHTEWSKRGPVETRSIGDRDSGEERVCDRLEIATQPSHDPEPTSEMRCRRRGRSKIATGLKSKCDRLEIATA
jgi:hypothetical protein